MAAAVSTGGIAFSWSGPLGCPGKGFLWLSPLWRVRQELETYQIMAAAMQTREAIESVKQLDSPLSENCDALLQKTVTALLQPRLKSCFSSYCCLQSPCAGSSTCKD